MPPRVPPNCPTAQVQATRAKKLQTEVTPKPTNAQDTLESSTSRSRKRKTPDDAPPDALRTIKRRLAKVGANVQDTLESSAPKSRKRKAPADAPADATQMVKRRLAKVGNVTLIFHLPFSEVEDIGSLVCAEVNLLG